MVTKAPGQPTSHAFQVPCFHAALHRQHFPCAQVPTRLTVGKHLIKGAGLLVLLEDLIRVHLGLQGSRHGKVHKAQ